MTRRNTREIILKAAKEAFSKKGYDAVSIDEIAQIAGVRKSLIYYYFPSKEALFEEVWINSIEELENELFNSEKDEPTYITKIKSFLRKYIDFLTSKKEIADLLRKEKAKVLDKKDWENAKSKYENFLQRVEELIIEGKNKKVIKEEVDPKAVTEMIASVDSVPRKTLLKSVEEMLIKILLKDNT
ncbi:TetR family transcriptional regulator [Thermosipho melanesiensis]|uniref:Transcriptional regulator, TetR family n=2 Tax=Thermosipho melanesiensis TaxID=46541 RepID=A6LM68_THEM4|nr:TetR/AcrR family transcriptional regulator [Thermosipho melanesiensis]ABR31019.1 transcriptional regulator, TetR family [Thermosipho melanesiensis BI429]APT74113.1 TetR family transcriptional regulator [Thermosipho melanesiensis]OOC36060.1 TetR family transcriptional regulator [Thermosipho melanesiensis]OOC36877.1 TetR family transcriptional regulator [Thermosipho melanesiensis]OOC37628.1 TetR family transcriptional regulator [Thermosipho melanesiensis]